MRYLLVIPIVAHSFIVKRFVMSPTFVVIPVIITVITRSIMMIPAMIEHDLYRNSDDPSDDYDPSLSNGYENRCNVSDHRLEAQREHNQEEDAAIYAGGAGITAQGPPYSAVRYQAFPQYLYQNPPAK